MAERARTRASCAREEVVEKKAGRTAMTREPELSGVHETAVNVAAIRAVHLLRDGEPKVLRDDYALALTGWSEEQALSYADRSRELLPSMYTTWICRARFAEDRLALARARGVSQYVVLGAGLDSFALRHAERLGDLVVYEVDDPPMQAWKRWRLRQLDVSAPPGLRFVPCDFEQQRVGDALMVAGFDADAAAFVSWLGVTQYLTRPAIAETLRWAGGLAGGSEILAAYLVPSAEVERAKPLFAARGTPFETFLEPSDMDALLTEVGLGAEHVSPEYLDAVYFRDRDDGLRAPTGERLVLGLVS
jgi:methyltransferase (TIGR00027 family)